MCAGGLFECVCELGAVNMSHHDPMKTLVLPAQIRLVLIIRNNIRQKKNHSWGPLVFDPKLLKDKSHTCHIHTPNFHDTMLSIPYVEHGMPRYHGDDEREERAMVTIPRRIPPGPVHPTGLPFRLWCVMSIMSQVLKLGNIAMQPSNLMSIIVNVS